MIRPEHPPSQETPLGEFHLKTPPLVKALVDYDRLQRRRFHVPSHAGLNLLPPTWDVISNPYRFDLTEVEGLDVLSEPSECLADAQASIAALFGVTHSFFLVNGASVGLMAAMLALVQPGDKVLLPRNVHRSVLNGLILTGAEPVWMLPERLPEWGLWGAVNAQEVERQLAQQPKIKALFVTSPTYEGLGSDIPALLEVCRAHGVYLVVDEAHGSLWPFSEDLPTSACQTGCDVVVHSMHKTGGSLTQSALAHLPQGSRVDPALFQQALNMLQTTSPSYLLMASLEAASHTLALPEGQARIRQLLAQVRQLRESLHSRLKHYRLFEPESGIWDPCKLYFRHPGLSGESWGPRLEADERIAYEAASPYGVLYLAGLGLESEDYAYFLDVMRREDERIGAEPDLTDLHLNESIDPSALLPEMAISPRAAFFAPGEQIDSSVAVGRIARETIVHCPPGIPILMPGERIMERHLNYLPPRVLVVR